MSKLPLRGSNIKDSNANCILVDCTPAKSPLQQRVLSLRERVIASTYKGLVVSLAGRWGFLFLGEACA